MKLRVFFATLVCRLLRFACRLLHRGGTAAPGRIALKICPQLLSVLAKDVETVAITGTNGKTTGARLLEQGFACAKLDCFSNRSGANLIDGITTEFVMNSTLGGKCKKKYAVIECDEGAAKKVFAMLRPKVIVVTNLFRDQLDRFGEVTTTLAGLHEAISHVPDAVLCLNADCPLTASLSLDLPNRVVWYGVEQGALPVQSGRDISDATHCIRCKTRYEYDYVNYGHLGGFRCPKCGYRRQSADYAVTDVCSLRLDGSDFVLSERGEKRLLELNIPAAFNIYNAAGAYAALREMAIDADACAEALKTADCGFGRMERFELGRRGARMMLIKNPIGCNQVLSFISEVREKYNLVLALNDRVADGTDISWIWDADFERLAALSGWIEQIVVSGDRAAELANRIKYAGVPKEKIRIEPSYDKIVDWAAEQELPVLMMPTYTAMLELRETVVKKIGGSSFWE